MPLWIVLPISLICAGVILYRYRAIGRLAAGIGWSLIILAIGGSGSGLAESFSWAGFVFLFIGAAGLLIVVQDAIVRRRTRPRRSHADS